MKTKIIPFDLETAKKIQAGKIKGRIKQIHGEEVQVLCWDLANRSENIMAVRHMYFDGDEFHGEHVDEYGADGLFYDRSDGLEQNDLVLEVPDDTEQEPRFFKPFDRVLVRYSDVDEWVCAIFSHYNPSNRHAPYFACGYWRQCIPYVGNEDLVGTTNKPKEE